MKAVSETLYFRVLSVYLFTLTRDPRIVFASSLSQVRLPHPLTFCVGRNCLFESFPSLVDLAQSTSFGTRDETSDSAQRFGNERRCLWWRFFGRQCTWVKVRQDRIDLQIVEVYPVVN